MLGACSSDNDFVEERVTKGSEQTTISAVPFGFSVGHMGANTRMSYEDTQQDEKFRGIEFLHMIPFDVRRNDYAPVGLADTRVAKALYYSDIDGDGGSASTGGGFISDGSADNGFLNGEWTFSQTQSRLYKYIDVPNGTQSFLVYGRRKKPTTGTIDLFKYGALVSEGVDEGEGTELTTAAAIKFTPQQTCEETSFPTEATDIINYLNSILNSYVTYTQVVGVSNNGNQQSTINVTSSRLYWDGTGEGTQTNTNGNRTSYLYLPNGLSTAYNKFKQEFDGIACSANVVLTAMNSFIKTLPANNAYSNNNSQSGEYTANGHSQYARYNYAIYNNLVGVIRDKIGQQMNISGNGENATVTYNSTSTIKDFPSSNNLPDICYIKFVPNELFGGEFSLVTGDDLDVIVVPAHYTSMVYPPELWYYANSPIKTTEYLEVDDNYMKNLLSTSTSWDAVLADRHFTQNKVRKGMTALLVEKPMNYAVGRMDLTVMGGSSSIVDGANNSFEIPNNDTNEKFPLTGVIVAKQHPVGFNFQPNSSEMFMVYDKNVTDGIFIRQNAEMGTNHTLVLPSVDATNADDIEKVNIILEFQNNSGEEMRGTQIREGEEHCRIPNGAKFYLVGEIDPSSSSATGTKPKREDGTDSNAVFVSDHVTTVKATVKSFKDAYNIVPDLTNAMMTVSLKIEMNWEQATPKSFLFE